MHCFACNCDLLSPRKKLSSFFQLYFSQSVIAPFFLSHSNFYLFPSHRVILRSVFRAEILFVWKHYQLISQTGFIPYCSKILSYARMWNVSFHNKNIVCQSYFRIFLFFLKNMVMLPVHSSLSCNKTWKNISWMGNQLANYPCRVG
jgi:hypothetical protein